MPRPIQVVGSLLLPSLPFLPSCEYGDAGPPLVIQRDSAGIEIVEAMRPLWGDSSLWHIDPDPVVDLKLSGTGPAHEFHRAHSMNQRPDGSLMIADGSSREVRVFSGNGEFPAEAARVPANSEACGGSSTRATPCWPSAADASPWPPTI